MSIIVPEAVGGKDHLFSTAWIGNHMPSKVLNENIYPFPNFNAYTAEVWEWISKLIQHFVMDIISYTIS